MEATLAFLIVCSVIALGVHLYLADSAYKDMNRRGQPGWLYGGFVLCVPVVGLAGWLIGRRRYPTKP